jgi:hypothetical protein
LPSLLPQQARADEWPSHAIRIIVPFGAGGAGDTLARIVAQHLSETFGQPFVVEDRPGAGGIVGTQQIVTAAPDGYTIGITNLSTLSLIPVINPEATYNPLRDLKHIGYIGGSPVVLAANVATHATNLHDVVAYASAPGHGFTFSWSGVGSDGDLMGVAIATALNVKPQHVPYKSTAEGAATIAVFASMCTYRPMPPSLPVPSLICVCRGAGKRATTRAQWCAHCGPYQAGERSPQPESASKPLAKPTSYRSGTCTAARATGPPTLMGVCARDSLCRLISE